MNIIPHPEPVAPAHAPTPLAALALPEIPSELHFVRDHFNVPAIDPETWALRIGDDAEPLALDLDQLRARPRRTVRVVLECAGHRRAEFDPPPPGLPWGYGAVSEARWTGVRLSEVLKLAGIPPDAREVVLEGADAGEFPGISGVHRFARSLPLEKALDSSVLLAYELNGEPLEVQRGGPVRAVVPGWYATDSVKWLTCVRFSAVPFDGPFEALDYRLQAQGEAGPGRRLTELPVHALITTPTDGERPPSGPLRVRGVGWGGDGGIARVEVRLDNGPWRPAALAAPRGRYARTFWELPCNLSPGAHQLSCRATDRAGNLQPAQPIANVGGYANNAVHRIGVSASTPVTPADGPTGVRRKTWRMASPPTADPRALPTPAVLPAHRI